MKSPPFDPSTLSLPAVLALLAAQTARQREALKPHMAVVPVADEALDRLCALGDSDAQELLTLHPGQPVSRKLHSLWQMLSIFEQAHSHLIARLDEFETFSATADMHRPVGRNQLAAIEIAVNKELLSFSAAAGALVAFSRRLMNESGLPEARAQLKAHFDEQEHAFVMKLRNGIVHEEMPDLFWQINYGSSQPKRTDFIISGAALDQMGLNEPARAYVSRFPDGVKVRPLANSYAERVSGFYAWYRKACEESVPAVLSDYRRINTARKRHIAHQTYRLLLTQYLSRQVDPYQHLDKQLLPDQIQEALRLPMRSKEQVDFIIEAADTFGVCDEELRAMVYRLFKVAGAQ